MRNSIFSAVLEIFLFAIIFAEASGKVTSVEELEARMRQGAGQSPVTQNSQNQQKKGVSSNKKEEELIAFKKLASINFQSSKSFFIYNFKSLRLCW